MAGLPPTRASFFGNKTESEKERRERRGKESEEEVVGKADWPGEKKVVVIYVDRLSPS